MIRSFLGFLILIAAVARLHAEPLADILARMDADSKHFKAVTAAMHQVEYNFVLKESSKSDAEMRIRRAGGGFAGIIQYKPPETRVVAFSGQTAEIYYPGAKEVQKIHAGQYLAYVSEFLLFGTSGKELKKLYTVTEGGVESIGSTPATHLVLTPKSADLQKLIIKLEIWIPQGLTYPIQERATEPSQNTELFSFSDVKINPHLPDSAFELKVPPGTKVVNQK